MQTTIDQIAYHNESFTHACKVITRNWVRFKLKKEINSRVKLTREAREEEARQDELLVKSQNIKQTKKKSKKSFYSAQNKYKEKLSKRSKTNIRKL